MSRRSVENILFVDISLGGTPDFWANQEATMTPLANENSGHKAGGWPSPWQRVN